MLPAGVIVLSIFHFQSYMPISAGLVGGVLVGATANVFYFLGAVSESIFSKILKTPELPLYRGFAYLSGIIFSLGLFALIAISGI